MIAEPESFDAAVARLAEGTKIDDPATLARIAALMVVEAPPMRARKQTARGSTSLAIANSVKEVRTDGHTTGRIPTSVGS